MSGERVYVPRVLCSPGPIFPSLHETGEHRTLFLKKGPLFPAIPKKGPMFPDMYVTGDHRTLFFKKGSYVSGPFLALPVSGNAA